VLNIRRDKGGIRLKGNKPKTNWSLYYHEGMDRTDIICQMIGDHLLCNPAIKKTKNKKKVQKALDLLGEVYQNVASHYWDYEDKKEEQ